MIKKFHSKLLYYIRHNFICIAICKLIKWDYLKPKTSWTISTLYMKKTQCIFKSKKMHSIMYLPYYKIDDIQKTIVQTKNYYDFHVLDYICKKWNNGKIGKALRNSAFIDIGANIGNHTLYLFNECNAASSYNFEPIKDTFNILEKNIKLNGLLNKAHLFNLALGQKKGNASLSYYDPNNIGMAQITNDDYGELQVMPLDAINIQDDIKFVKIDVEGFELDVVRGMTETLKKYNPYIMIEIRHSLFSDIDDILKKLNYERIEINRNEDLQNCLYVFKGLSQNQPN